MESRNHLKNGEKPKILKSRESTLKEMKKSVSSFIFVMAICLSMTSCYTYTATVGNGAQTGVQVKKANHYLIYGLADVGTSDAKAMAGGATDYDITIKHTFVDGLLNAITFGIYTPTTTIVTK